MVALLILLNGGASEHKTKRIVKDKNQLQEQLIYLGSGFIESYKCYTLSTSIREIHPVSHVSRDVCGVGSAHKQHLPTILCPYCVRALAKLIVLEVKTSVLSEVLS